MIAPTKLAAGGDATQDLTARAAARSVGLPGWKKDQLWRTEFVYEHEVRAMVEGLAIAARALPLMAIATTALVFVVVSR